MLTSSGKTPYMYLNTLQLTASGKTPYLYLNTLQPAYQDRENSLHQHTATNAFITWTGKIYHMSTLQHAYMQRLEFSHKPQTAEFQ